VVFRVEELVENECRLQTRNAGASSTDRSEVSRHCGRRVYSGGAACLRFEAKDALRALSMRSNARTPSKDPRGGSSLPGSKHEATIGPSGVFNAAKPPILRHR
jgi:hypothetical protein